MRKPKKSYLFKRHFKQGWGDYLYPNYKNIDLSCCRQATRIKRPKGAYALGLIKMILTEQDIIEYQGLIKKRYSFDIPKEQALKDAMCLIQFVKLCIKTKQDIEK